MKNLIYLLILLGFVACKKDDPCENITCINGGTCVNGSCNCPDGYQGADCSQQTTPSRINIKSITVTKFPIAGSNGASWDFSNGADIYVDLTLNGTLIATNRNSAIFDAASVPVGWSSLPLGFEIDEPTNQYTLTLYDADDFPPDDYIDGIIFTPYSSSNGFPLTRSLSCSSCDVAFDLTLDYDF